MGIFISLLVVVQIVVSLLLVFIVLMQRPKQEGLGAAFGGGMTDQMFGAQTTDVLQKATVWLTVMFFVNSMILAILIANRNEGAVKLTESLEAVSGAPAPIEATTDGLPSLPKPEAGLTPAIPVEGATPDEAEKATPAAEKKAAGAAKKESAPEGAQDGAKENGKAKGAKAKKDAGAKDGGAAKDASEAAGAKAEGAAKASAGEGAAKPE